jgi:hypothetical protein
MRGIGFAGEGQERHVQGALLPRRRDLCRETVPRRSPWAYDHVGEDEMTQQILILPLAGMKNNGGNHRAISSIARTTRPPLSLNR